MNNLNSKSLIAKKITAMIVCILTVFMFITGTIGNVIAVDEETDLGVAVSEEPDSDITAGEEQPSDIDPGEENPADVDPGEEDPNAEEPDDGIGDPPLIETKDVAFINFPEYFKGLTAKLTGTLTDEEFTILDTNSLNLPLGETFNVSIFSGEYEVAVYNSSFTFTEDVSQFDMDIANFSLSPLRLKQPTEVEVYFGENREFAFYLEENRIKNLDVSYEVTINGETVDFQTGENSCVISYDNIIEYLEIKCTAYYTDYTDNSDTKTINVNVNKYSPNIVFNDSIKTDYNGTLEFTVRLESISSNHYYAPKGSYEVYVDVKDETNLSEEICVKEVPLSETNETKITIENFKKLSSEEHTITVKYFPDDESKDIYETTTDTLSVEVIQLDGGNINATNAPDISTSEPCFFIISEGKVGSNGWYTGDITLVPQSPFDMIQLAEGTVALADATVEDTYTLADGTPVEVLADGSVYAKTRKITEETPNGNITFKLLDSETGELSKVASFTYKLDKTAPSTTVPYSNVSPNVYKYEEQIYHPKFTIDSDWSIYSEATQYFYQWDNYDANDKEKNYLIDGKTIDKIFNLPNRGGYRYFLYQVDIDESISSPDIDKINQNVAARYNSSETGTRVKFAQLDNKMYCFVIAVNIENLKGYSESNTKQRYGWDIESYTITDINSNIIIYDKAGNSAKITPPPTSTDYEAVAAISYLGNISSYRDTNYDECLPRDTGYAYNIYNSTSGIEFEIFDPEKAATLLIFITLNGEELYPEGIRIPESKVIEFNEDGEYTVTITSEENENYVIDNYVPVTHIVDKTAPTITTDYTTEKDIPKKNSSFLGNLVGTLSFGFYNPVKDNTFEVKVTADDITAGVDYLRIQFVNEDKELFDFANCDITGYTFDGDTTTTLIYENDDDNYAEVTLTLPQKDKDGKYVQYRGIVNLQAVDRAGNSSAGTGETETNGVIVDTVSPKVKVEYSAPDFNEGMIIYKDTIDVTVTVNESNFFPEDIAKSEVINDVKQENYIVVYKTLDGKETLYPLDFSSTDWTQNPDGTWTLKFSIGKDGEPNDGNYIVKIKYQDTSENIMTNPEGDAFKSDEYTSDVLIIDTTAPVIDIELVNAENADKKTTAATITVTDRNFRPTGFDGKGFSSEIEALDIKGEIINTNPFNNLSWTNDGNEWTATAIFTEDANYSFDLTCIDLVENNTNASSGNFTIDNTIPEISEVKYSTGLSDNGKKEHKSLYNAVAKTLSFGFYNPDIEENGTMEVTVTAYDVTSDIDCLRLQFINENNVDDETRNLFDFANCDISGYTFATNSDGTEDTTTLIYQIKESDYVSDGKIEVKLTLPQKYNDGNIVQYRGVVNLQAVDMAGLLSKETVETEEKEGTLPAVIIDNIAPQVNISYEGVESELISQIQNDETKADIEAGENTRFIYNGKFKTVIEVEEANFFNPDTNLYFSFEHTLNGETLSPQNVTPTWKKIDTGNWVSEVEFSEDGDYVITVKYNDYSENAMNWTSGEYNQTGQYSYISNVFTIDTTSPKIDLQLAKTENNDNPEKSLKTTTATITVEDKNFHPSDTLFEFFAKDVNGKDLEATEEGEILSKPVTDMNSKAEELKKWEKWTSKGTNENGDEVWQATLEFTEDANYSFDFTCTDLAGNNTQDGIGNENNAISAPFTVDNTAPTNLKISYSKPQAADFLETITFGYYNAPVTVTISADDIISGVSVFNWTYTREKGASESNKKEEKNDIEIEGEERVYQGVKTFTLSPTIASQYRGNIDFTVTDNEGNTRSTKDLLTENFDGHEQPLGAKATIFVDNIAPDRTVEFSAPKQIIYVENLATYTGNDESYRNKEDIKSILFYDGEATATIKIEEINFYPEKVDVMVNEIDAVSNQNYTVSDWTKNGDEYTKILKFSKDGDYVININYIDKSTNEMIPYQSQQITIDTIDPKINVQYSQSDIVRSIGERAYYGSEQTVTVKVEEHNFRADDIAATITAVDAAGAATATTLIANLAARLKDRNVWTHNGDIHTATITYSDDANYTFDIDYKDLALRASANRPEDLFTVDTTAPTNLSVSYTTNVFSNVLNTITFGYYNEKVTVTISAEDTTSGVYSFDYSALLSPNVSSVNKEIVRQSISETTISYSYGRRRATATFEIPYAALNATNQFDGTVDFTAYDRSSKNSAYADSSNRIIVDNISPVINVTYNEPFQTVNNTSYYAGAINGSVRITEANFYSSDVNLTVTKNGTAYPVTVIWRDNNVNEHIGTFTLTEEGDYVVNASYSDRSKNQMNSYQSGKMTIDTVKPTVSIKGIKSNSANNSEIIGFTISSTDANFDPAKFNPVISVVTVDENGNFEKKTIVGTLKTVIAGKEYSFVVENLNMDGIYSVTCNVTDLSGNTYNEFIVSDSGNSPSNELTFSVNRSGSTFALDENAMDLVETYYVQSVENDIVVFETNVDPLQSYEIILKLGSKETILKEDVDFTVTKSDSDDEWQKYTYKINKSLFEEEGEYKVVITSKDKAGNDAYSDIKSAELNFTVDKTSPTLSISGIKSNGIYSVNEQTVSIIPRDDGGKIDNISVVVLNNKGKETGNFNWDKEALTQAEENGGNLTFDMSKGYNQAVRIVSIDYAGNSTNETYYFDNVTISTNRLVTFYADKTLFWSVIIGTFVLIGVIILLIVLRQRKRRVNS